MNFSDSGSGFDVANAAGHVFNMYKRLHANAEGRGLRLFLVKEPIEAMGGRIEVTSHKGTGTTFMMWFK